MPHVLSCHCWHQAGHHYIIEAAENKATIFCFLSIEKLANIIFFNQGRTRLMLLLMEN